MKCVEHGSLQKRSTFSLGAFKCEIFLLRTEIMNWDAATRTSVPFSSFKTTLIHGASGNDKFSLPWIFLPSVSVQADMACSRLPCSHTYQSTAGCGFLECPCLC